MRSSLFIAALSLMAASLTATGHAQSTPAPPDWQDQPETSVYDGIRQQAAAPAPIASQPPVEPNLPLPPREGRGEGELPSSNAPSPFPLPKGEGFDDRSNSIDTAVVPAAHQEPADVASPTTDDPRRLAPPTNGRRLANRVSDGSTGSSALAKRVPSFGLPTNTIFTVVSALGIVLGAFLIFAWALRRGSKRSGAMLPSEVVTVLGRVPLAGRQFAELLRVGNKLVLVALTPGGAEPITEVTDPAEVDRLTGLCEQSSPHSTTKAFEHVFQQLSRESAPGGFLGEPSLPTTIAAAAEAYRSHRGGTAHA